MSAGGTSINSEREFASCPEADFQASSPLRTGRSRVAQPSENSGGSLASTYTLWSDTLPSPLAGSTTAARPFQATMLPTTRLPRGSSSGRALFLSSTMTMPSMRFAATRLRSTTHSEQFGR